MENFTNQNILGTLFGTINYDSEENLNKFIDELNSSQAVYCLHQAINYAHSQSIFTMKETEILSKSLRMIFQNKSDQNTDIQP
jgi:hypothetical protein